MTAAHAFRQQVHVVRFVRTLHSLQDAWQTRAQTGHPSPPLPERLQARCIQCGIALTPAELAWLLQHGLPEPAPQARLRRIQHGYCARRTCDSYFYELAVDTDDPDEAACLAGAAESLVNVVYSDETSRPARWTLDVWSTCCKPEMLAGLAAVTAAGLVLWWNFRTPSWAARPTGAKYQANGSSITVMGREPGR